MTRFKSVRSATLVASLAALLGCSAASKPPPPTAAAPAPSTNGEAPATVPAETKPVAAECDKTGTWDAKMAQCAHNGHPRPETLPLPYSEVVDAAPCALGGGNALVVAGNDASFLRGRRVVVRDVHADFGLDAWSESKAVMLHAAELAGPLDYFDLYVTSRELGHPVRPGSYTKTGRAGFEEKGRLGFTISGGGRECNSYAGDVNISGVKWVGEHVASFGATFRQTCGRQSLLTGCVHVENRLLLQAERDLSGAADTAPPSATEPSGAPASAYRAHDPGPCQGGGERFFVDTDRGHAAMRRWPTKPSLAFEHPQIKVRARPSSVDLQVKQRGEPGWHLSFAGTEPLAIDRPYAAIARYAGATGKVYLSVDHESCDVTVARFRFHELDLAPKHEQGTVTFEIQCRARNAVLRGCARFEEP